MKENQYLPLKFYISLIIFLSLSLLIIIAFDINFKLLIMIPPVLIIVTVIVITKIKDKATRDLVKSGNDMALFSISTVTAIVLIPKNIWGDEFGVTHELTSDIRGYLFLCIYIAMLSLKAYIAALEFKDNLKIDKK
ncbi:MULTISPECIES: hypothetical protein [Pectobacterium]|uniref:hypothetical protein n=1 Tax=Pectobacterium TaxID=122277 RepID=UPI001888256C|nr:hypothetical protein [Pectobacterium carotovorum]